MKFSQLQAMNDAALATPGNQMLQALQNRAGEGRLNIYAGTVPPGEVARRRRRNKLATKARRVQRLHRK